MKKLALVTLVIAFTVVPSFSFAGIAEWMNGTTHIYGHEVNSTISNGMALFCMIGPALVVVSYLGVMLAINSFKTKTA